MEKQRGAAWGEMRTLEMGLRACQSRGRCRGQCCQCAGGWVSTGCEEGLAIAALWFQEPLCTTTSPSLSCCLGW